MAGGQQLLAIKEQHAILCYTGPQTWTKKKVSTCKCGNQLLDFTIAVEFFEQLNSYELSKYSTPFS